MWPSMAMLETSRPTTHANPTYEVDGVIHYCVANMPGAVPLTSAQALNNATLPFVLKLADKGLGALEDKHLAAGLNVKAGRIVHAAVAASLGFDRPGRRPRSRDCGRVKRTPRARMALCHPPHRMVREGKPSRTICEARQRDMGHDAGFGPGDLLLSLPNRLPVSVLRPIPA